MTQVSIAQVIYSLVTGGSEVLACRLASGLAEHGRYAPCVYGLESSGPLRDLLVRHGIPARAFNKQPGITIRLVWALARQLRQDRVQLVHTHHLGQLLYGAPAARLAGARVIHTEHEFYTLARPRAKRLLRVMSRLADRVTAVAEPVARFLRVEVGIPDGKLVTIPNGVQMERFASASAAPRSAFGWEAGDQIIGCVARLEPEKGHALLLDAFRMVHARQPRARLLLVGEGGQRPALTDLVRRWKLDRHVCFLGGREDVPELVAACDVVALASHHEGLPIALLEAMAADRPVVATAVGGVPDLIRHERTGLLVPAGDAGRLAESICRLLGDPALRRRLAAAGRADVQRRFSFDRSLEQYEALYGDVLKKVQGGQG